MQHTTNYDLLKVVLVLVYLRTSLAPRSLANYGSSRPTGSAATPRRTARSIGGTDPKADPARPVARREAQKPRGEKVGSAGRLFRRWRLEELLHDDASPQWAAPPQTGRRTLITDASSARPRPQGTLDRRPVRKDLAGDGLQRALEHDGRPTFRNDGAVWPTT